MTLLEQVGERLEPYRQSQKRRVDRKLRVGDRRMRHAGGMLDQGRAFLLVAPHLTTVPGLAIGLSVLGFNFLGDGLRDAFEVRLQQR